MIDGFIEDIFMPMSITKFPFFFLKYVNLFIDFVVFAKSLFCPVHNSSGTISFIKLLQMRRVCVD
jgi:hypothetical protein